MRIPQSNVGKASYVERVAQEQNANAHIKWSHQMVRGSAF
jgi:hypothetical protein